MSLGVRRRLSPAFSGPCHFYSLSVVLLMGLAVKSILLALSAVDFKEASISQNYKNRGSLSYFANILMRD